MITTTVPGVPGLDLPGLPAGERPVTVRRTGVLLEGAATTADHHGRWGGLPLLPLAGLVAAAEAAGLRGAGGAGFPFARKLRAFADRRVAAVIVNGSEGEPTSAKDGSLLTHSPHLVLDGAVATAHATGATRIVVVIDPDRPDAFASIARAAGDRGLDVDVRPGARGFVSGEATAVINQVWGKDPAPGDLGLPPRAPGRRPGRGHVLLSNVETFARLALAVRGVVPATTLATVSGAVMRPGVYESPATDTLSGLAEAAGVDPDTRLMIGGGWHGSWLPWPAVRRAPLSWGGLESVGGRWGAAAFLWLPPGLDPYDILAAIARVAADESAGQCGPCRAGLPALADALAQRTDPEPVLAEVDGRGLCAHPSATAAAVRSALTVLGGSSWPR